MRISKVVGKVTLSCCHPNLKGAIYLLANPLTLDNLLDESDTLAGEIVVYDELGADEGSLIAISEGGEAAQPFLPENKPVDAYAAAILDRVNLCSVDKLLDDNMRDNQPTIN